MLLKSLSSRLLVFAVGLVLLALLAAAGPARAGTLDQQQTSAPGCCFLIFGPDSQFGAFSPAQTFTAGLSGGLDQVDLVLGRPVGTTVGPLSIEIRDVVSGAPGATVLASASVPATSVPEDSTNVAWVAVAFASPAPVVAGTQYAIVAYTGGSDSYYWGGDCCGDPYAGGAQFLSNASPPSTWQGPSNADLAFKTYVAVPPALPTTEEDCKNGGWQNYGGKFKNQGDCVSFVASGGKNPPTG